MDRRELLKRVALAGALPGLPNPELGTKQAAEVIAAPLKKAKETGLLVGGIAIGSFGGMRFEVRGTVLIDHIELQAPGFPKLRPEFDYPPLDMGPPCIRISATIYPEDDPIWTDLL